MWSFFNHLEISLPCDEIVLVDLHEFYEYLQNSSVQKVIACCEIYLLT